MQLVLLHAFPLDGRMWSGQMAILPESTIAPTLYSLGDSMQTWASRVLEMTGDGPLIVVGCSMGGSCALEMARQAGPRIAAIVLVGAKAGHRPEPEVRDGFIAALQDGGTRSVWPSLVERFFGPASPTGAVATAEALAMEQNVADLIRAVGVFHSRPDATDVVRNWRKPLLVVSGERDGFVSVAKSTGIAASAGRGRLFIIRDCGHFVNMERPIEFNAILEDVVRASAHRVRDSEV